MPHGTLINMGSRTCWFLLRYGASRLRAGGRITNGAVKAKGRCRLCPSILSPLAVRATDFFRFPIEQAAFARNDQA